MRIAARTKFKYVFSEGFYQSPDRQGAGLAPARDGRLLTERSSAYGWLSKPSLRPAARRTGWQSQRVTIANGEGPLPHGRGSEPCAPAKPACRPGLLGP
jgi:hypothetical protein